MLWDAHLLTDQGTFGLWQSSTHHPPPSLWGHPSHHPEKEWRSPAHRRRGSSAATDIQVPLLYLPFNSLFALAPLQLGVGVKGGCEAIIHAISSLISSENPTPHWTPLFDFSNAFDNISREAMFKQIRRHVSSLSAWMESCYSSQALLCLGKDTVLSCCGVQQGDPLGPLGFALSLHPIVEHIRSEVPDLALNAWYLDDFTPVGSPEDLMTALGIIERDGPSVGLHLNRCKSLLFIPEDIDASQSILPKDIPISRCGFTVLGSSIGTPSYCQEVFKSRVAKKRLSLTWIMLMFLYVNVSFHMLLMRLSTSVFSPLPLPPVPDL